MSMPTTVSRLPSRSPSPGRVLGVDDSTFFRRGILAMLQYGSRIQVIGTPVNGREAVVKTAELHPDVVIMGVDMRVLDDIGPLLSELC
ncbi:MAG: hypothetical protein IT469_11510 [Pseudomonadales bacterium]|nr:hypothetical protein [Pseudomonadales bacterium]